MKKVTFAAVMMVLLSVGVVLAQPHPEMIKGMPPMGPCFGPPPTDLLDLLDLTTQQKVRMVALLKQQMADMDREEAESQKTDRREAFTTMQNAMAKGDVESVRALTRTLSAEHEQHAVKMATFIAEFRAILSDAQRARIDKVNDRMKARLEVVSKEGKADEGKHAEEIAEKGHGERMMPDMPPRERPRGPFSPRPDVKHDIEEWIKQNS